MAERAGAPRGQAGNIVETLTVAPLYQSPDLTRPPKPAKVSPPLSSPVPSKTKLSTIEAKRIMSVLDEAIDKVELVTLLSAAAAEAQELEGLLGAELTEQLCQHEELCQDVVSRIQCLHQEERRLQEAKAMEDWSFDDAVLALELQRTSLPGALRQAKGSTRDLLRALLAAPQAQHLLQTQGLARDGAAQAFIEGLYELRNYLLEKLLTSPAEAKEKAQFLHDVSRRHHRNLEIVESLEKELGGSVKNRDAEVEKENFVIQELKNHMHQVLRFSENSLQRTRQDAEKQQKADVRSSQARLVRTQQEIVQLRAQLHNLVVENREVEQALRKKKYKVETEIENWIQKYDSEMREKQDELEELEKVHKEEKVQLQELRQRHQVLVEEFTQIQAEREVSNRKRLEAEQELLRMVRAATLIQSVWKGYLVRSMLKSKRKKRGKDKGKGKGKK